MSKSMLPQAGAKQASGLFRSFSCQSVRRQAWSWRRPQESSSAVGGRGFQRSLAQSTTFMYEREKVGAENLCCLVVGSMTCSSQNMAESAELVFAARSEAGGPLHQIRLQMKPDGAGWAQPASAQVSALLEVAAHYIPARRRGLLHRVEAGARQVQLLERRRRSWEQGFFPALLLSDLNFHCSFQQLLEWLVPWVFQSVKPCSGAACEPLWAASPP